MTDLFEGSAWVSAREGENLDVLVGAIGERLRLHDRTVTLRLPLDRGDLLAAAHREGEVLNTAVEEDAVVVRVLLDAHGASLFRQWRVSA